MVKVNDLVWCKEAFSNEPIQSVVTEVSEGKFKIKVFNEEGTSFIVDKRNFIGKHEISNKDDLIDYGCKVYLSYGDYMDDVCRKKLWFELMEVLESFPPAEAYSLVKEFAKKVLKSGE